MKGSGGIFGRFSSRPEGSWYPKAELLPRLLARLTDFIFAAILPTAGGAPGTILALLYLLFCDGLFHGQSPGKRLLGIKVIHLPTRRDVDFRESALRNFPFAFAWLLYLLPEFGPFLVVTVGSAILAFEGYQVWSDSLGLRLGDLFAETQVVDTKVLAGRHEARPRLQIVRSDGHARTAARAVTTE
jgi:uncharacterized RDD family membrane protein YckC